MPKRRTPSAEELQAFAEAVKGTEPLANRKERVSMGAKPKKFAKPRREDDTHESSGLLDGGEPRDNLQDTDSIQYSRSGIPHKTLRKLAKGQYNVEAILDLHRKTVEEARLAVDLFLTNCLQRGVRCALIIHGKGKPGGTPILKNYVYHWLKNIKSVIALSSAAPRHGGQGAVYILLKAG